MPLRPSDRNPSSRRTALLLFVSLTAVYVGLIVYLDNTNLSTTNGLWKSPWIHHWEIGTGKPVDSGDLFYLPAYGFLCRLIPDQLVSYGVPGRIVTYRKIAILNAAFSAVSSWAVFFLALHFVPLAGALLVALAHSSMAFVLLQSLNSEDVMPAYAFFALATLQLIAYVRTGRFWRLVMCAVFLLFVTVFHWTLMIPAIAAVGAVLLASVLKRRSRAWLLVAFPVLFAALVVLAALLAHFLMPSVPPNPWQILYPPKAGPSGAIGFGWNKLIYALIGIGNYYFGGQQLSEYRLAFSSPFMVTMVLSWICFLATLGVVVAALLVSHMASDLRLLAIFGAVLFGVGELEHLYSQPQDPQSQLQPMFVSVVGLILILRWLGETQKAKAFRISVAAGAVLSLATAVCNLLVFSAYRGQDSQSVTAVRELAQLFPAGGFTRISHAHESWNTWWYLEEHRGDWADYQAHNILLMNQFTDHANVTTEAAAEAVKRQVNAAMASGQRVVACSLWTEEEEEFAGWMTTIMSRENAEAYYSALRKAFRTGKTWETPAGRFVELLPLESREDQSNVPST